MVLGGVGVGLLVARSADAYANAPLGLALACWWRWAGRSAPCCSSAAAALYFGDGIAFMPAWPSIAVITYIALMPMALGNVVWFSIVRVLPANVAALSAVMVPVVAMVCGVSCIGSRWG